ncbi:MAG: DUF4058 family protein [Cyanobacteria bacterium P01_D01_bin.1]
MANRPAFPGMDPYLENPGIWPEVHYGLLGALMRSLNPQLNPKYRVAVEKRVYVDNILVGISDTAVFEKRYAQQTDSQANRQTAVLSQPEIVSVPMPQEVSDRYLEIREVGSGRVVTVVELLSPKNKQAGEGRKQYLDKRQRLLATQTHLIEIDLLRAGQPMLVEGGRESDYRILVSRAPERLAAQYCFDLQDAIPPFPLPLSEEDVEPVVDLAALLNQTYQEAALELAIDYEVAPVPALDPSELAWVARLSRS